MSGSKFLQRIPAGPQRPSPRTQLALRGVLSPTLALGALDGSWEDWCDSDLGKERYAGGLAIDAPGYPLYGYVCKRDFVGGGAVPFAPWTDVGQYLRFSVSGFIPSSDEFEPKRLWKTMYTDYLRFNHLFIMGQAIPLFGTVYMMAFPIMAYNIFRQEGFAKAKEEGITEYWAQDSYSYGYVWKEMLSPAVGDALDFVGKFISHGLWTSIALKVCESEARNTKNSPNLRAVYMGIGKFPALIDIFAGGIGSMKFASSWVTLGDALKYAGTELRAVVPRAVSNSILAMGEALIFGGPAFAALLDVTRSVEDRLLAVRDHFFLAVTGVEYAVFQKMKGSISALKTLNIKSTSAEVTALVNDAAALVNKVLATLNFSKAYNTLGSMLQPLLDIGAELVEATSAVNVANMVTVTAAGDGPASAKGRLATSSAALSSAVTSPALTANAQAVTLKLINAGAKTTPIAMRVGAAKVRKLYALPTAQPPAPSRLPPTFGKDEQMQTGAVKRVGTTGVIRQVEQPTIGEKPSGGAAIAAAAVLAVGAGYLLLRKQKTAPPAASLAGAQRRKYRKTRR